MATMAQLNTRMDVDLKAAGDSVLDLYGFTPSWMIRSLWSTIAHGKEAVRDLLQVFKRYADLDAAKRANLQNNATSIVDQIMQRQLVFEQELGLDPATFVELTDEENEEMAYEEMLEKERARSIYYAG